MLAPSRTTHYVALALAKGKKIGRKLYLVWDYLAAPKIPDFIRVHVGESENGANDVTIKFMEMGCCIKQASYQLRHEMSHALNGAIYFLRERGYSIGII